MSDKDKQEAADKAARAVRQSRHATRNAADAAEAAAGYAKDEIVDGVVEVKSQAKDLTKKLLYTELGRGALIVGAGLLSLAIGVKKLQAARQIRADLAASLLNVENLD